MHWNMPSGLACTLTAVLIGPFLFMGAAQPSASPTPVVLEGEICPPSFTQTILPCCSNGQGGHDTCAVVMTVTPTGGPGCTPCKFKYDVTVVCATCGSIQVEGESGIVCASREGHLIPCPDGVGNAVTIQFICGACDIPPSGN